MLNRLGMRALHMEVKTAVTENLAADVASVGVQITQGDAAIATFSGGGKLAGVSGNVIEDDTAGSLNLRFFYQKFLVGRNVKFKAT